MFKRRFCFAHPAGDVAFWPEGEVLTCVRNVCSLWNCGRDVLAPSLTGFAE
jgi:hypothetical protein